MVLMYQPRKSVLQRQKRLKQQSERKWRCDNGRRDSGSGADHPWCFNANLQLVKEAEKEEKSSPDRYGRGFLGALLGALIGALAFVGLFAWGYLEVIAPVVGVVTAHYLYGALGGKPSVKKIVTVGVVCLVFTLASFFACYFVQIALYKPDAGLFAELKRLFAEKEGYASRFIVTLVFSIAFLSSVFSER